MQQPHLMTSLVLPLLRRIAFIALAVVLLQHAGCSEPPTGTLIVGVTSDFRAGTDLVRLDVLMTVDGETLSDTEIAIGTSAGKTDFPAEFGFEDVADGSELAITLIGWDQLGEQRVVRHMKTTAVADSKNLVRVHLESLCMLRSEAETVETGIPGAPTCNETSQTCIAGACSTASVAATNQQPYTSDWATDFGDACKPVNAADPIVTVGRGQSDYLAAEDYELGQIEAGPQGGHHIWVAARIKNLHQSGSITEVGGEIPALGLSVTPLKVIFTFDADEGGYCKIYGLRFQLDIDGGDIQTMLNQEAKVIVTVTDSDGDTATGERWFILSSNIL